MATAATIQFDESQKRALDELLAGIKNGAARAQRTALNRTLTGAVALVAKEIGATVTLKSATIKDKIRKKNATLNNLSAVATLRGPPIPLIDFQNRQLKSGVSIKVFKNGTTTKLRHAFYATMTSGHTGIFMRDPTNQYKHIKKNPRREKRKNTWGSTELAIVERFGPTITTLYEKTPGLAANVEQTSAERLQRELSSQIDYLLGLNNDGPDS